MVKKLQVEQRISIVAAMGLNRVMGKDNKLPWHLPDDLARFYQLVKNKTVIMGRKTYVSIGHPLETCRNIIVSRQKGLHISGCEVYSSFTDVLKAIEQDREVVIIGGSAIYKQFLPVAATMYLTMIQANFVGDVYFPRWQKRNWHATQCVHYAASADNPYAYDFITYQRANS